VLECNRMNGNRLIQRKVEAADELRDDYHHVSFIFSCIQIGTEL
jgi:hypothetical protein